MTKFQQKQTTQFLCDAITSGFHCGFKFSFDGHALKKLYLNKYQSFLLSWLT
jgi:hypothetical protein